MYSPLPVFFLFETISQLHDSRDRSPGHWTFPLLWSVCLALLCHTRRLLAFISKLCIDFNFFAFYILNFKSSFLLSSDYFTSFFFLHFPLFSSVLFFIRLLGTRMTTCEVLVSYVCGLRCPQFLPHSHGVSAFPPKTSFKWWHLLLIFKSCLQYLCF